jgi:hypothetical protein
MMASDSVNLFQEGPPVASGPVCAPIKSLIFGREVLRASACRLKVVLYFAGGREYEEAIREEVIDGKSIERLAPSPSQPMGKSMVYAVLQPLNIYRSRNNI